MHPRNRENSYCKSRDLAQLLDSSRNTVLWMLTELDHTKKLSSWIPHNRFRNHERERQRVAKMLDHDRHCMFTNKNKTGDEI